MPSQASTIAGAEDTQNVAIVSPNPVPVSDNGGSLTVDGTVGISNFPATQPISAASLPLPTGAATSALQTQPGVDIGDVTVNNGSGAAAVPIQDGGNSVTVDNSGIFAVQATQSGSWTFIPDRPSQKTGRTYKTATLLHQNSTQTLYTVTSLKVLYVTSIALSGYNTSTANAGQLEIRDNATLRIPVSIPTAGVGALASQVPVSSNVFTFLEPLQFSTSVVVTLTAGTLTYSISLVGYEE